MTDCITSTPQLGDFSVNRFSRIAVLCLIVCFLLSPALVLAEETALSPENTTLDPENAIKVSKAAYGYLGIGIGAGLAAVGGGIALGILGSSVVDAAARQPEMRAQLTTIMFIVAALIEGLALFALVICILCLFM